MWWIIGFFVIAIFFYFLFAKLLIEVDSTLNLYRIKYGCLAAAKILFSNDEILIEVKFLSWKRKFSLNELIRPRSVEKENKIIKQNKDKTFSRPDYSKLKQVFNSFKITKCFISIDTGSMPLNGILFPFFYLISIRTKKLIRINFLGENAIILRVENCLARMLWALIKS